MRHPSGRIYYLQMVDDRGPEGERDHQPAGSFHEMGWRICKRNHYLQSSEFCQSEDHGHRHTDWW